MPFATVDNCRLYYRLEGAEENPVLVLSHSISTDSGMWAPQVPDLLPYFQLLRFDTRGHGASDGPPGEYSIERLGRDVLGLLDALGISKFAFCGLSMGGAVGQWLAAQVPERVTSLVLANTSAQFVRPVWEDRIQQVKAGGMAAIVDLAMGRLFSAETLARRNPHAMSVRRVLLATDPVGYLGCCAALRDMDHRPLLRQIKTPTLVFSGDQDVSTPWAGHGEILAREIPGARAIHLPATHLSNIERPRSFTAALLEFLMKDGQTSADPLQAGTRVRRSVLGDAHVDQATAAANDFTREFQTLITRYAWGTIWTRPGLDRRTRRLLVVAMMAALGRWEEFKLHVRTGLQHELEPCDLQEVLLQTAIYAGVPAANTGFHLANEEIEKARAAST